jgi:hypothetical protein
LVVRRRVPTGLSALALVVGVAAWAGPAGATGTATVAITKPAPYASIPAGATQITGQATDTVGVKNVSLTIYNNDLKRAQYYLAVLASPNAPSTSWSLNWQPPSPGSYNVTASTAGASGARSARVVVFFDTAASSGTAYLSLVMSRAQLALADASCQALPGAVPLDQVASTMQSMGVRISGSIVTSYIADGSPSCVAHGPVNDLYPTWTQLGQFRDNNGMMFTSAGVNYVDDTTLPTSQALANICGSLMPLAAHGHTRAWALYSYPNNHYTTQLQSQVTDSCFAYGRTYASARAHTTFLSTAPYFEKTFSILGGACNDPAQPCYNLQVIGAVTGRQTFYTPVDQLARMMQAGAGEWSVVQMYKFVTGSYNPGAGSGLTWDCTAPDWHDHYVSDTESYCWNDFLTAVATIPSTVTVAQPDAVAEAWSAHANPPTTTITSGAPASNATMASFSFTSSNPRSWFSCSLDGGVAAACTSPITYNGVGQGGHTFAVQATDDLGVAGNTATSSWSVGPGTMITGTPQDPTASASATFQFSATDPNATFQCSLDRATPTACSSSQTYSGVDPGFHVFSVQAVDQAGHVGPASTYSWLIDGGTSGVLKAWALQSENANSNHQPVAPDQALADASNFDVIIAHPIAYENSVAAMRAINPRLTMLAYQNAVFAQPDQGSAFPANWYEYDANGHPVRNKVTGNYLMNPAMPGWVSYEATLCQQNISASSYDGCYMDLLGLIPISTGFVTASPINPSTAKAWTKADWLAATTAMAKQVAQTISPIPLYGNGLGGGPLYYGVPPTSQLMQGLGGGVAEAWLRGATVPDTQYPSDVQWVQDVSMMTDIQGQGKPMLGLVKVWGSGTQQQIAAWQQFGLATFLMGTNGQSSFTFSGAPGTPRTTAFPVYQTQLGEPLGPYTKTNGIYQRWFVNGMVLLNTSAPATTVNLPRQYFQLDGTPVTSENVGSYSGIILTLSVPPTIAAGSIHGPANPTSGSSASFTFSSAASGATYFCSLDGSEPAACQPGVGYNNLASGPHIFAVQAVDQNGVAGPQSTYAWMVGPPVVTIVDGPSGTTSSTTATFDFAASESSTFVCSLDGQTPSACTSPVTYSALASGPHTLTITASASTGTGSANASWTVS